MTQNNETIKDKKENKKETDHDELKTHSGSNDVLERISLLEQKIAELEGQKDEYLNGWKRAKADLINFRNQMEKEKNEWAIFFQGQIIQELLPIVDSFEQALQNKEIPKDFQKYFEGFQLIYQKLWQTLKNLGLEEINIEEKKFDPFFCEIIEQKQIDELDDNKVVQVVEKGYIFREKVLRPAKIIINKKVDRHASVNAE